MGGFLTFVRYELLMHVRSWRLWLCLAALSAAPWLMTQAMSSDAARTELTFSRFVYGGTSVLAIVLIIITVDSMARVRTTGVQPVLFTKPFSTLTFILACWVSVVILAAALATASLLARHYVARYWLDLEVHLGALGWVVGLVAMPMAVTLVALVIWVRTVFKHNVSAYLVSGAAALGLFAVTNRYRLPLLGWSEALRDPLVLYYMPAVGRDIDGAVYGAAFLNVVLLSLLFLALACYHMRRQEPQRRVLGSYGNRWTDMPTFVRFLFDLKIDRRVGGEVHLLLAGTLLVTGFIAARTVTQSRAQARQRQQWAVELRRDLRERAPATPGVWTRHYAGRLAVGPRRRVECDVEMEVMNTTATAVERVVVEVPFGVEVTRFESARGESLNRRRWGNLVAAELGAPLAAGATTTIHLAYAGRVLALEIGDLTPYTETYAVSEMPLESKGVSLGSRYMRLGIWLLPRTVSLVPRQDGIYPVEVPHLFTANLEFTTFNDLILVSPDGLVEPLGHTGGVRARLRIDRPQNDFTLLAGPYEGIERTFGPARFCIYGFTKDRDVIEFILDEYAETIERWATILGPPHGPRYALTQTLHFLSPPDGLPLGTLYTPGIDRLRRAIPLYEQRDSEGFRELYNFQMVLRMTLAGAFLRESLHLAGDIESLRKGLYAYLTQTVQRSELGPTARRNSRLFQSVSVRGGGGRGGFLDVVSQATFDAPLVARLADPSFDGFRAAYVWRLFHYLLEDEKFAQFLRALTGEFGDRLVRLDDLRAVAERLYGEPLDWFFDQWFFGTGVPEYEIAVARATMVENQRTRDIEYDVEILVTNKGRGRMPVPVVLRTEGDTITRKLWLGTASSATLTLRVPDRPELAAVDPEGWIPQVGSRGDKSRSRGPAQRAVRIIE